MIEIHRYLLIEFMLIFFRVISMIVILPFIGSSAVPNWVKIGTAFFISVIMYPLVVKIQVIPHISLPVIVLLILSQVIIGLILGFLVLVIFSGVELAGQFAGFQIGYGMMSLINPLNTYEQVSLLANMQNFIALMIFLISDAYFIVLDGLYKSFQVIPLTFFKFSPYLFKYLAEKGKNIFVIGFELSIPLVFVALFMNIVIAIMGRLAPQFNIFAVGFPMIIVAGLVFMFLFMPYFSNYIIFLFHGLNSEYITVLNLIAAK
ncbi:MAG: flagellar biosynthetic protein FliR [bacterium]